MMKLHLLLTTGAAARITRLITRDTITRGTGEPGSPGDHLGRRLLYDHHQRAALDRGDTVPPPRHPAITRVRATAFAAANCDWCAGIWVSAPIAAASALAWRQRQRGTTPWWFDLPASALTIAHAVGYLASTERH